MNEIDIMYMEACDYLEKSHNYDEIAFLEGADSDKSEKWYKKAVDKIKKMITTVIEKVKSLFESKASKEKTKKLQEAIKKNPSLKNKKIKIKDYNKAAKLNKETRKKLSKCKTKEEAEKTMDKYRKQRNIILGAGAAVTVSLGAALAFMMQGKNKQIGELNQLSKELEIDLKDANENKERFKGYYEKEEKKNNDLLLENDKLNSRIIGLRRKEQSVSVAAKDITIKINELRNSLDSGFFELAKDQSNHIYGVAHAIHTVTY